MKIISYRNINKQKIELVKWRTDQDKDPEEKNTNKSQTKNHIIFLFNTQYCLHQYKVFGF